ncbi:DUF4198 domain-containing protein [Loktanella sp. IMCC34160]|uniref:DUF4198 domain-containing protein n=1 Tax=Loktanella sp. IMCC34160 TaxID=2510646 RepID=UPI00101C40CE|nr:DUF4198 domain-containing protein [Loktanella sp. IMCC34160]RYG92138.1 DUF4198 domain-containing protein [Loktanella sp. IMCC34160]
MRLLALFCLSLSAGPLAAHEFWLEPSQWQVAPDARLEGRIVNGQSFAGIELAYIPQRTARYEIFNAGQQAAVEMRAGDRPGLSADPLGEGLNVVIYQTNPSTVDYETWEKFQSFVDHKDLGVTEADQIARGLPLAEFSEVYFRFSKTLIAVGDGAGADLRTGMETEIVALTNPYTDDLTDGVRVQLFYQYDVRAEEQIEVFDRAPDGEVTISYVRTDADGIATVPVVPGHDYMLDAVVLREPAPDLAEASGAVWETLWANLTFAVPN